MNQDIETRSPSPDSQSDIIVKVDGVLFALHKFLLCSRSGCFNKLVTRYGGPDPLNLDLPNLPGGAIAFELAAKFCYGVVFEIDSTNVAALHCVAEYLGMTEEFGSDNLLACTESYLTQVVFESLKESCEVLCSCQDILLSAEDVKLTGRCIDAIASIVCDFYAEQSSSVQLQNLTASVEWWANDLLSLSIDFFKQVLITMKCKGLPPASMGSALMRYAGQFLKPSGNLMGKEHEPEKQWDYLEHRQRVVVETIVSLLPMEKGVVPTAFLFGLLRTAYHIDTTVACRMALEKRIGAQLESATIQELLVPQLLSQQGDTFFDVDLVHRVVANFVQHDTTADLSSPYYSVYENGVNSPSSQVAIMKVAKLVDSYLAEIAADSNLDTTKFINLVALLPEHARVMDDGIYRAIDIYLKVHPTISDEERRKICTLMDCEKLSQKACSHAAQNERLPVHVMVQVLYIEQQRLRSTLSEPAIPGHGEFLYPFPSQRMVSGCLSHVASPWHEDYLSFKKENEDLRLEVLGMKSRLHDQHDQHLCKKLSEQSVAGHGGLSHMLYPPQRMVWSGSLSCSASPFDHYSSLKQENEDLRLEVLRMRARLNDLEQEDHTQTATPPHVTHKPSSMKRLLSSVSRTLGLINHFARGSPVLGSQQHEPQVKPCRMRRKSLS